MTTVADALTRAALQCRFKAPSGWVSATTDDAVLVRDVFLDQTVRNLQDRIDLPSPIGKQTTVTGDGSESYALPSDFRRIARDPMVVYEKTTTRRAGIPVASDGVWTHLNQIGSAGGDRYYSIEGYDGAYTIRLFQNPTASVQVTVSYVSNLWMATAGGTAGNAFTDDTDVLLFPLEVIATGIVWRFRRDKGLPYEDAMAEHEAHVARLANDSRTRRKLHFGASGLEQSKVMRVPVPDYIPDV